MTDFVLADTRIGSGSDHTVFLNYVGIPVIGLSFDGPYGVYHSAYDNFYWMNHFGDPGIVITRSLPTFGVYWLYVWQMLIFCRSISTHMLRARFCERLG